jgi:hypothetical protein
MPTLAELQASLARRLTADPAAEKDRSIGRAARALQHKRMRAVAQLLPRTREALGSSWPAAFAEHAASYQPCGLLYHVDDAWEFAAAQARGELRIAARRDLTSLELLYVRSAERGAHRVRERTGVYFRLRLKPLLIGLRLPGRQPTLLQLRSVSTH